MKAIKGSAVKTALKILGLLLVYDKLVAPAAGKVENKIKGVK